MLAGAARGQQATDTTVVYYRQGYSVVELTLRNNRAALEGFLNRFNASMQDSTLHLVSFRLDAYASPEGTAAANDRLSENRAKRLAEYICSRTGLSESDLTIEGHGIDWEQLEEKTAASDVPYKEEVLDVLRNTPEWIYDDNNRIIDGRKHRLGMLRGGVPYNYLSEHIFPLLRRSCITLSYTVEPLEQPAEERPAEERPGRRAAGAAARRGCRTARSGTRFHSRTGGGQAGVPAAAGREDQPALLGDGHARLQKLYVRSEPRNRVFLQRALVAFRHRRLGEMGIRRRRLFRNIVLQPRTPLVVQGRRAFPLVLSGCLRTGRRLRRAERPRGQRRQYGPVVGCGSLAGRGDSLLRPVRSGGRYPGRLPPQQRADLLARSSRLFPRLRNEGQPLGRDRHQGFPLFPLRQRFKIGCDYEKEDDI